LDELNIEPHLLTLPLVQHPPASALNAPHTNLPSSEVTGSHINSRSDTMPIVTVSKHSLLPPTPTNPVLTARI
jgi:hypothetical protein